MAAHQYWRVLGIEPYDGGPAFEISEFWLMANTTRVDASATLTSSIAPISGTLANTADDDTQTAATLSRHSVLQWDFGGSPQDVTDIRIGAAASIPKFPLAARLQWSDDGVAWTQSNFFGGIVWPGVRTKTQSDAAGINYFSRFRIYMSAINGDTYAAIQEMEIRAAIGGADLTTPSMATDQSTYFVPNNNNAARAFDNNFTEFTSNVWVSDGTAMPQWISINFASIPAAIGEISIWPQNWPGGGAARAPKDFIFQGSTDGFTWIDLLTVVDSTGWVVGTPKTFAVPASAWPPRIKTRYLYRSGGVDLQHVNTAGVMPTPVRTSQVFIESARPNFLMSNRANQVGRVRGTVAVKALPTNTPWRRKVSLLRERDLMVVAQQWSDATTGAYDFQWVETDDAYTVLSHDYEHNYRAVVADGLTLANGGVEMMP